MLIDSYAHWRGVTVKPKIIYANEWVRTSMLSKIFRPHTPCEKCGRLTAGAVYYSLVRDQVRCTKCIDVLALADDWTTEEWEASFRRLEEALRGRNELS